MKIKILITCIALLFISSFAKAQSYQDISYLDDNFSVCNEAKAVYICKTVSDKELFRMDCFTKKDNILLLSIHYTDTTSTIKQGKYQVYYVNGKLKEEGYYANGIKDSIWKKWDDIGFITDSSAYKDGKKNIEATYNYYKDKLGSYFIIDSLKDTMHTFYYDSIGKVTMEVMFTGQRGIVNSYDSGKVKTDSVFSREEKEASFPGGDKEWRNYLMKNLNASVPVNNRAPEGTYTVIVKFIVSSDGTLSDVKAETKKGYGMEEEVLRLIKNGPKWIPGVQYGRKVNSYRRQPVTFVVQSQ
jgi:hypothetical protein